MTQPNSTAQLFRFFRRPQSADDPIRPLWYRIHRDNQYEPSNVEARFICQRLRDVEAERDRLEGALRAFFVEYEDAEGGQYAPTDDTEKLMREALPS